MTPAQDFYNDYLCEFWQGRICVSILRGDSVEDIRTADKLICDCIGRKIGFGAYGITDFVLEKIEERNLHEMQIAYHPESYGRNLGWMGDDREWYPAHGFEIVPLAEFISNDDNDVLNKFNDVF